MTKKNMELNESRLDLEKKVEVRSAELLVAQEKINRQEKAAAVSKLAGAVSHDLRNPLGTIGNSVYFLKLKGGGDEMIAKHMNIIEREIAKADKILADVLDFSRTDPLVLKRYEIGFFLENIVALCEIPENIQCHLSIPPEKVFGVIDLHQMTRVLNNLITNAVQAMPDGGELAIILMGLPKEQNYKIHVKDSGCGIEAENLEQVFAPLYSSQGKGIGMGLASARDIVELHGGSLDVTSEVGQGSEFILCLNKGV